MHVVLGCSGVPEEKSNWNWGISSMSNHFTSPATILWNGSILQSIFRPCSRRPCRKSFRCIYK